MRRLLIRPGAIGDCILAFPAMEFLRAEYTEIWISTPVVPLVAFADRVCSISSTGLDLVGVGELPISPELAQRLRSFDEIVSWYGTNREEFRRALCSLPVACRFYLALPPPNGGMHAADFFCSQVGAPPGAIPNIGIGGEAGSRDTIVIHPFSGSASKNWPLSSFREFARRLSLPVEWIAGPDELLPEAHRFGNLQELAHWLCGGRLYVGNDSGITHLAAAVGIPTIALFGSTLPSVWAPRGRDVQVLQQEPLTDLTVGSVAVLIEKRFNR